MSPEVQVGDVFRLKRYLNYGGAPGDLIVVTKQINCSDLWEVEFISKTSPGNSYWISSRYDHEFTFVSDGLWEDCV